MSIDELTNDTPLNRTFRNLLLGGRFDIVKHVESASGVRLPSEIVQEVYLEFAKSGTVDGIKNLYFDTKVEPEIPREVLIEGIQTLAESFKERGTLPKQYRKTSPRFDDDAMQLAYWALSIREHRKSDTLKFLNYLTGATPTEKSVQEAYMEYFKMGRLDLISELKEATSYEPKFSPRVIRQKFMYYADRLEPKKIKELEKVTGERAPAEVYSRLKQRFEQGVSDRLRLPAVKRTDRLLETDPSLYADISFMDKLVEKGDLQRVKSEIKGGRRITLNLYTKIRDLWY